MKKLLYIPVNTKPEHLSTSKTVSREFVNRFLAKNPTFELMEIDICNEYVPELNYKYYNGRAELVSSDEYAKLNTEEQQAVARIKELSNQFVSADAYVIAAPMWSSFFPARLITYIDCVIQKDKVLKINEDKVEGLLDDKKRTAVYIQSSGGVFPKLLSGQINHGTTYIEDIFKFIGIKDFHKLMVEGTGKDNIGVEGAEKKAFEDMDKIIDKMSE
ncbi:MAG: FMN-dependent NADH-azoreductase [Clostridiales bacterium]|jgi:FMN-dependent NADH-azoreductase|nr:FMN-dependent NADH-azoreductase [Clostridiales bacterium]